MSKGFRYKPTERAWVKREYEKMTAAERAEYERRMAQEPVHPNSGKHYDDQKARVMGEVMQEFRRLGGPRTSHPAAGAAR